MQFAAGADAELAEDLAQVPFDRPRGQEQLGADPARQLAGYYPVWLGNLADGVTLEGSMMDGFVQGAGAVRDRAGAHPLAVGPFGDNGWFEDYTAGVRGEPIKNLTVVTRNAAGQTQHVVGSCRPRSTLLLLSRLIGDKFAGTAIGEHFLASQS